MDRHSSSLESINSIDYFPPVSNNQRSNSRRDWRSRSRSRDRYRGRGRSKSRSRERAPRRPSPERDLYKAIIDEDFGGSTVNTSVNWDRNRDNRDKDYHNNRHVDRDRDYYRHDDRTRDRDRDRERERERERERDMRERERMEKPRERYPERRERRTRSIDEYDEGYSNDEGDNREPYYNQKPNKVIRIRGLAQHITEADINSDLIKCGMQPLSVRLIRKKTTGASRGFAFVEFNTEEEAIRWMNKKQGVLMLHDQNRATMQYSFVKDLHSYTGTDRQMKDRYVTDWYCAKCGVFNFKRRDNCFKCFASREESEKGGEGSDEVSSILTKKIMLRNLDVLTNEEGVLQNLQIVVPSLVSKIAKILICRDPLTSTSRGICYLNFDNLVDSMNTHNALKSLETPLKIDNREVVISYCVDSENRTIDKKALAAQTAAMATMSGGVAGSGDASNARLSIPNDMNSLHAGTFNSYQYQMADVPRLAEYSASLYASNPVEHEQYMQFYSNYYATQISKGQMSNFPTVGQIDASANSGAAVAQSAIQWKKQKGKHDSPPLTIGPVQVPNGKGGRKYPTPDVTQYQWDETSGFYYDHTTGLYYDGNSQYYYNSELNAYMYWDQEKSTYLVAPTASTQASAAAAATAKAAAATHDNYGPSSTTLSSLLAYDPKLIDTKTQLTPLTKLQPAAIAPAPPAISDDIARAAGDDTGKKGKGGKDKEPHDKVKVAKNIVKDMEKWAKQLNQKKNMSAFQAPITSRDDIVAPAAPIIRGLINDMSGYADVGFSILEKKDKVPTPAVPNYMMSGNNSGNANNKLVSYGSDSDPDQDHEQQTNEKDYLDFEKLTCLLCKRAFQSLEIFNKHLKMSQLHKENLQKHNLHKGILDVNAKGGAGYRDRAKERRLKYGEVSPPPVNKSKERFQREMEKTMQRTTGYQPPAPPVAATPIGENNVGNKLLQKMGWKDGQGLGRSNQGRTQIIEAEKRVEKSGLGSKMSSYAASGDDYKTYIKKMMKSRYENAMSGS